MHLTNFCVTGVKTNILNLGKWNVVGIQHVGESSRQITSSNNFIFKLVEISWVISSFSIYNFQWPLDLLLMRTWNTRRVFLPQYVACLLYLSCNTCALIGQLSEPYIALQHARMWSWFCCKRNDCFFFWFIFHCRVIRTFSSNLSDKVAIW